MTFPFPPLNSNESVLYILGTDTVFSPVSRFLYPLDTLSSQERFQATTIRVENESTNLPTPRQIYTFKATVDTILQAHLGST